MALGGRREQFLIPLIEIGQEKDNRLALEDAVQITQSIIDAGRDVVRAEFQDVPHQTQRVRASFLRTDKFFDVIGKQAQSDLVRVADRGKPEHGGNFSGEL